MATDKEYNKISKEVYRVDSGKVDNPVKQGDTVAEGKYKVLATEDNLSNGMQAMAVAPIDENGNPDTSQVVIAYAGTNAGDGFNRDILTDIESIGLGSDGYYDPGVRTDSQFETAQDFAKEVEKNYPHAEITTTGHSLGESVAMYVALEQGYNNVGFNGPDIHNLISEKQVAYMQKHPEQFRNYRNPNDAIGNITGNKTDTAIYVAMSNKDGLTSDHNLTAWKFDKDGNLVDKNGNRVSVGVLAEAGMKEFMKTTFTEQKTALSKGGLTGHETIFLDYLEASAAAASLAMVAQNGETVLEGVKDTAVKAFEDLYNTTKKRPASVNKLSMDEIKAIYEEEGVTYQSMVTKPKEHFEGRQKSVGKILTKLSELSGTIETGLQALVAEDTGLGEEISAWTAGM